jgi:hypothetical protein
LTSGVYCNPHWPQCDIADFRILLLYLIEIARRAINRQSYPSPLFLPRTTSAGGSKAASKSDWSPLAGRVAAIWPDNDQPGIAYAIDVERLALAAGVRRGATVTVPSEWPEGWDLADPLPERVTLETLAALLRSAKPWVTPVKPEPRAAAEAPANDDEAEIARLAKLTVPQYERERDAAAKRLGMRVGILDKEVAVARGGVDTTFGGRELALHEPEPWPDAVDGAELLDALAEAMRRHVVMSQHEADVAALWVIGTHTFNVWRVFPRLSPHPSRIAARVRCSTCCLASSLGRFSLQVSPPRRCSG